VVLGRLLRDQRVVFVLVGGANTLIGLAIFAVIFACAGRRLGYLSVLCISYALAVLTGFYLQRRYVFDSTRRGGDAFARYALVQVAALLGNAALLLGIVEGLGAPVLPGQATSLALTVVATYCIHRRFTFHGLRAPGARIFGHAVAAAELNSSTTPR